MARANVTPEQWASALLQRLGVPQSKGALQAVVGWERAEGGHYHNDARYNPLNTTMPAKGAGNTGTQGNIKVYRSWNQGLNATVRTLKNGLYGGIIKALKSGNPNAVGQAIEKSPWGTGGLAAKVIGQTKVGKTPASALLGAAETTTPVTSTRSSDNMGGGADALSLLQALQASTIKQPRASAGLPAPAFSAQPAMPAGAQIPQGSMGQTPQPDITQLLAAITTPGGDVAKTTVTGGDQVGSDATTGGATVKGAVVGSPVPGLKPHKATHETAGLPGYPAYDYMAKAGTPVVAPVSGKIVKLSGHDPNAGPTQGPHGPFGWSIYLKGDDGKTYYLTHLGERDVKLGKRVKQGSVIGAIGNYAKWGGADHVHVGVHG